MTDSFILRCKDVRLDARPFPASRPLVMGILNITPDSFSDGGRYLSAHNAATRALEMIRQGADIIDVGGESSRPRGDVYGDGASALSVREEIDRIKPVIESILEQRNDTIISVDTYKPEVADAALGCGASILNDITALRYSTETAHVAAGHDAPLVMMHSIGDPGAMPHQYHYQDVVLEVKNALEKSVSVASDAGVDQIVVDPGFGFGKSTADNFRLLNHIDRLLELNRPVLIGLSRKSAIGKVLGSEDQPAEISGRLFGGLGATAVAVQRGASIIRTHDVKETVEFLELMFTAANPDSVI